MAGRRVVTVRRGNGGGGSSADVSDSAPVILKEYKSATDTLESSPHPACVCTTAAIVGGPAVHLSASLLRRRRRRSGLCCRPVVLS